MLPHTLSSGICSLVEGEDRLVKSVFLTFSNDKLIKTEFENSIHSQKRLTYRQAYALLKQNNLEKIRRIPAHPVIKLVILVKIFLSYRIWNSYNFRKPYINFGALHLCSGKSA